MFKVAILIAVAGSAIAAEISHVTTENLTADVLSNGVGTHEVFKKHNQPETKQHPVFKAEEHHNVGRARIELVRPRIGDVKHDMLADEPSLQASADVDRMENLNNANYGYANPVEVAYPDIPYAPGYGYAAGYPAPNSYDLYPTNSMDYLLEPNSSAFSLLWSQVPDARTMVNVAGRTIGWIVNSLFVIMFGSILTVGFCTYTNLCQITFNGIGPIHEEMRSLITPDRLEKIGNAADFLKTAIDKYQKIQTVADVAGKRSRRAIFFNN